MDNKNNINTKLVTSDILTKKFITETDFTKYFINKLEKYLDTEYDIKSEEPILLLDYILGEKSDKNYNVENNFIFSIPKYDISIISYIDSKASKIAAYNFYDDVVDDIAYYIKLYEYEELLGKPREKKYKINHFIIYDKLPDDDFKKKDEDKVAIPFKCDSIIKDIFYELYELKDKDNLNHYETQRKIKAMRCILTESINDAKEVNNLSESRLDIIKNFIKNYDKDQLNFIHYDNKSQQTTKIQGIAGSGKTFLLLHKLIREYIRNKDSKIIMTCHNKSLVVDLRSNINSLANSLKIKEQIDWKNRLTLSHAWDIYKKICDKLRIDYYPFSNSLKNSFKISCSKTLKDIESMSTEVEPIYDFIFIDEAQDLPDKWIELCEKISKKVYVAFDIFQNIFNIPSLEKETECDYTLSHCYRTPPLLLMFGHSIAMGLFENDKKIQWFNKPQYWEKCGYIVKGDPGIDSSDLFLSRHPLSRFENEEKEECLHFYDFSNIDIYHNEYLANKIIEIINNITINNSLEDRLHEIIIIDNREDYNFVISLSHILDSKGIKINNIIESKERSFDNRVQFTNVNNVKGLEFGFVIITDITLKENIISRNRIYMSLTRALLEAHIIFFNSEDYDFLLKNYNFLQERHFIKTKVPTSEERDNISKAFNTSKKYTPDKNIVFEILKEANFKGDKNKFIAALFDSIESNDNKKIESEEDLKNITYELLKFYN